MTESNADYVNYYSSNIASIEGNISPTRTLDSEAGTVDWTPIDSSYGAACPMCGWIPKKIRKKVEAAILFSIATLLVSFVITASIRLSSKGSSSKNYNSIPSVWTDDQTYYNGDLDGYYNDTYYSERNYDDIYKSYDDVD